MILPTDKISIPSLGFFQISLCPNTIPVHPSNLVLGISIAPDCRHGVQSIRFRTVLLHPLPPEVLSTQGIGSKWVIIFHRLTKPPGRFLIVLFCPVTMGIAFSYPVPQITLLIFGDSCITALRMDLNSLFCSSGTRSGKWSV